MSNHDRRTGAKTGQYSILIKDIKMPYILLQEFGNHKNVRWTCITNKNGAGLVLSPENHALSS